MGGPNFFLVGAAKSGTTTLYHALREHDDIYLPAVKEPHLYAYLADPATIGDLYPDEVEARRQYRELYRDVADERAVGDASTSSLLMRGAAQAIARDVPSARIIAILRHPVDRAYAHYRHFVAAGGEDVSDFAEAVRAEGARQAAGFPFTYQYFGWGRYSEQLRPFFDLFGRDRVQVHLYDDFTNDPEAVVRATFRFLDLDDSGAFPPVGRSNAFPAAPTANARSTWLGRRRAALMRRPPASLDPSLRAELTETFREEISQLEDLLGRDLSMWLESKPVARVR